MKGYIHHNFDAVNQAVGLEESKAEQILKYYRHRRYFSFARIVLTYTVAICLLVLTYAILHWIFNSSQQRVAIPPVAEESKKDEADLEQIKSDTQEIGLSSNTIYTVFTRVDLAAGGTAVTGKSYRPGVKEPFEQYCYLEQIESSLGQVGGNFIAEVYENEVVYLVVKESEQAVVNESCRFQIRDDLKDFNQV